MMEILIGRYMVERETPAGHRGVYTRRNGDRLGIIAWHARWKCWEFQPNAGTGFTVDCLEALAKHIEATKTFRPDLRDA